VSKAAAVVRRAGSEPVARQPDSSLSPGWHPYSLRGRRHPRCDHQLFRDQFADQPWTELTARGAHLQRPLWASTSTKNAAYPTRSTSTISSAPTRSTPVPRPRSRAFEDHGTIDRDVDDAAAVLDRLAQVGLDVDDVSLTLEDQGVTGFHESFARVLDTLNTRARQLARR
jgi:transaldolase